MFSPRLAGFVLDAFAGSIEVAQVDVYAEAGPHATEVFVRDRGRGFDEGAVPEDRLGVRNSIVDRMRRHGGTAVIRTAPGDGTEVRLSMTTQKSSSQEETG